MQHESTTGKRIETDFITWRGMMTKIMAVPYSRSDEWEMNATFFQGTIFIEENNKHKLSSRAHQYQHQRKGHSAQGPTPEMMSYWGHKFETLSLISKPWAETSRQEIESREEQITSNLAEYCSVVRTGFGKIKMVLAGEVDAVWDKRSDDPKISTNWVELKTTAEIRNGPAYDSDMKKYGRKLMKFWIQSFLLGVPKIIVGFRTPDGILTGLEELETESIPASVKGQGLWDGFACINFAADFLEWLKKFMTAQEGTWRIKKQKNADSIEVSKISDDITGEIISHRFIQHRLGMMT